MTSIHDVLVASSRLARGDPATTIGVNMHFAALINMVRSWRIAVARGEDAQGGGDRPTACRRVVAADVVFAAAVSEPSPQDLTRPSTTATAGRRRLGDQRSQGVRHDGSGGHDPQRRRLLRRRPGRERYGFALVPTASPGVVFHDDWDALGMRASASGSVSFEDVRIGADGLRDGFPAGDYSAALLDRYLVSGAFHAAASLGIAEARPRALSPPSAVGSTASLADPHAVTELAANVVDLAAMRASFDRAGHLIDEYVEAHPIGERQLDEVQAVFGEVQASKAFLTAAAVRVVDRALALSGGAGYLAEPPAGQGVARRPGRRLHASRRRQPRRQPPRPHRARRRRPERDG